MVFRLVKAGVKFSPQCRNTVDQRKEEIVAAVIFQIREKISVHRVV